MYEYKIEKKQCASEFALDKFNGKWKIRIMCLIGLRGSLRYSEIKSNTSGITDNILSITMKDLTTSGLVEKVIQEGSYPKVSYTLTEKANELMPIIQTICQWANRHYADEIETACAACPYKELLKEYNSKV